MVRFFFVVHKSDGGNLEGEVGLLEGERAERYGMKGASASIWLFRRRLSNALWGLRGRSSQVQGTQRGRGLVDPGARATLRPMADAARSLAPYGDILALPEHLTGEILDGELVVQGRPAPLIPSN